MTRRSLFAPAPVTTQSNVQLNTGVSNSGMRQLASTLNKTTGSGIVKPYFEQKLAAVGRSLDDYFDSTTENISTEKGKSKERKLFIAKTCRS